MGTASRSKSPVSLLAGEDALFDCIKSFLVVTSPLNHEAAVGRVRVLTSKRRKDVNAGPKYAEAMSGWFPQSMRIRNRNVTFIRDVRAILQEEGRLDHDPDGDDDAL